MNKIDEQLLEDAKRIIKEADELLRKEPPTFLGSCRNAWRFWSEFWADCKHDKGIFYAQIIIIGALVIVINILKLLGVK